MVIGAHVAVIAFGYTIVTAPAPRPGEYRLHDNQGANRVQQAFVDASMLDVVSITDLWLEDNPDATFGLMCAAIAHERLGNERRARAYWRQLRTATRRVVARGDMLDRERHRHAWALHGLGQIDDARQMWSEHADAMEAELDQSLAEWGADEAMSIPRRRDLAIRLYHISNSRAMAGERDRALEALEASIDAGLGNLFTFLSEWAPVDPDLEPLWDEPCFGELLERLLLEPDEEPQVVG